MTKKQNVAVGDSSEMNARQGRHSMRSADSSMTLAHWIEVEKRPVAAWQKHRHRTVLEAAVDGVQPHSHSGLIWGARIGWWMKRRPKTEDGEVRRAQSAWRDGRTTRCVVAVGPGADSCRPLPPMIQQEDCSALEGARRCLGSEMGPSSQHRLYPDFGHFRSAPGKLQRRAHSRPV